MLTKSKQWIAGIYHDATPRGEACDWLQKPYESLSILCLMHSWAADRAQVVDNNVQVDRGSND